MKAGRKGDGREGEEGEERKKDGKERKEDGEKGEEVQLKTNFATFLCCVFWPIAASISRGPMGCSHREPSLRFPAQQPWEPSLAPIPNLGQGNHGTMNNQGLEFI